MADSISLENLYRESQSAICTLITDQNQHTMIPACPAWTLHDLLAHQVGVLQDVLTGNMDGAPGNAWTSAQVERFRHNDIDELRTIWADTVDKAGPLFQHAGTRLLPDVVTHEFDVRGALSNTDRRNAAGLPIILTVLQGWKLPYFQQHNIPAINLVADGVSYLIGEGEPGVVLTTSMYEASRVFTGRRSFRQIRALDWSSDPEPWLEHLSVLGQSEQDVLE